MDTIKEIESIRTDILDTIAKCECGDDCESVVYLKKIAGRLSSVSSCCRPLADAPAATPTPVGAASSAPVPSVPSVSSVPSNTAKLRETMELFAHANDDGFYGSHQTMYNVVKKAKEALAAPPRNCDVGTAEEQAERYDRYCSSHGYNATCSDATHICVDCPLLDKKTECEFAWAQLPYESDATKCGQ